MALLLDLAGGGLGRLDLLDKPAPAAGYTRDGCRLGRVRLRALLPAERTHRGPAGCALRQTDDRNKYVSSSVVVFETSEP